MDHISPAACFCSLIGTQPHSFIYILSMATFSYKSELSVRNRDRWTAKPKIFTIWSFMLIVCWLLVLPRGRQAGSLMVRQLNSMMSCRHSGQQVSLVILYIIDLFYYWTSRYLCSLLTYGFLLTVQRGSSQRYHFSSQRERREGVSKRQAASFLKRCDLDTVSHSLYAPSY